MFFERIRIKRKLASNDAVLRAEAVSSLDINNDIELLRQLAAADSDARVRRAAIIRFTDPEMLTALRRSEADPQVLSLLAERIDQLYGDMALRACAEERDCDAFDRIENADVIINVALRSNSPSLVLAAAGRLAAQPENWQKLLCQLQDDRLALEIYQRNMPDPDSAAALWLLNAARSQALREAIAEERRRRQAQSQAYAEEHALVEAAEKCAETASPEEFEALSQRFRELPWHDEKLKTRFMAARYRFFRAQEDALARREAALRNCQLAGELLKELEIIKDSGNWKLIRQTIDTWNRSQLNTAPGTEEFRGRFNELAREMTARAQAMQTAYSNAMQCAGTVLTAYRQMLTLKQCPPQEDRQKLLQTLEQSTGNLTEIPVAFAEMREEILNCERELRRRARLEAQQRDLARWEHYTLKMDICHELEKLSAVPDEALFDAARTFRTLRERWNSIGAVPNEKYEELRNTYHAACSALHTRLEAFFAERDARMQTSRELKEKLLQEAESLSGSDDWSETSARLKELQNLWKNAGSAGSAADRELFEHFHAACDAFFVRRNTVWEERKKSYFEAAKRKKVLCDAAEALKDKPFAEAKNKIADLREEWRKIPSAGKDDRLLYMQFNRAIESIFAAHREVGDAARHQAEIICTDLQELLELARSGSTDVKEIEKRLLANQQQWDAQEIRPAADVANRREKLSDELQNVICAMHHQEAMHKLDSAEQLESVIDPGDDNEKLIDQLGRRLKVCGELEDRLRECRIIAGGGDLAREIEQAFAGNFGGDEYRLTIAELDEFLRRFVAVGHVPPDARQAVFERFRTLYNRALTELEPQENSRKNDTAE